MKPPPPVDRVAASHAAVKARRARSVIKKSVAARIRSAVEVLDAAEEFPEGPEGRLRVTEFMRSVPAIGATKTKKIMEELQISPSKHLGGLGHHQRERLRIFLEHREKDLRHNDSRKLHSATLHNTETRNGHARLIVLAGPTAVGKGTVATFIREHYPDVMLSISVTTRPPRPTEKEGVSYFFVDDEHFDRMIIRGELLEWATVHNMSRYGTPRALIEAALAENKKVLLEIDIQGARAIRRAMPEAKLVFLQPPSWEELVKRLVGRGTETPSEQQRRLTTAVGELDAASEFDYTVTNCDVAHAAREVVALFEI